MIAGMLSCSSMTQRGFCFTFEKVPRGIVVIRIVFAGEANQLVQRQSRSVGMRWSPGKRMLRRETATQRVGEATPQTAHRAAPLVFGNELSIRVEAAIAYAVENGLCCSNRQSDVHLWHRSLKSRKFFGRISANGVGVADVQVGLTAVATGSRLFHASSARCNTRELRSRTCDRPLLRLTPDSRVRFEQRKTELIFKIANLTT